MPAPPRPVAAGFTLIELVLVLVVIAIAGLLATPAIGPALESVRFEAASRRTAAFLDDARRRAVLERQVLVVRCRPSQGVLELAGAAAGEQSFRIPEQAALVSCSPELLRYFPQGSATGMSLLLQDKRGRARRLSVGAFTGLTRVEAAP